MAGGLCRIAVRRDALARFRCGDAGRGSRGVRPAPAPIRRLVSADASPNAPSDLAVRSVVGIGLVAVAVAALWVGGLFFWLLCVVLGLLMMAEWADLHGANPSTKRLAQFALSVPLAIMAPTLGAGPGFLTLGLTAGAAFFIVSV